MYHSDHDEVAPYVSAMSTAKAWCSCKANLLFFTATGGIGHICLIDAFSGNATEWLDLRLSGGEISNGCTFSSGDVAGSHF